MTLLQTEHTEHQINLERFFFSILPAMHTTMPRRHNTPPTMAQSIEIIFLFFIFIGYQRNEHAY